MHLSKPDQTFLPHYSRSLSNPSNQEWLANKLFATSSCEQQNNYPNTHADSHHWKLGIKSGYNLAHTRRNGTRQGPPSKSASLISMCYVWTGHSVWQSPIGSFYANSPQSNSASFDTPLPNPNTNIPWCLNPLHHRNLPPLPLNLTTHPCPHLGINAKSHYVGANLIPYYKSDGKNSNKPKGPPLPVRSLLYYKNKGSKEQ